MSRNLQNWPQSRHKNLVCTILKHRLFGHVTIKKKQTLIMDPSDEFTDKIKKRFDVIDPQTKNTLMENRNPLNASWPMKQWVDCYSEFLQERKLPLADDIRTSDIRQPNKHNISRRHSINLLACLKALWQLPVKTGNLINIHISCMTTFWTLVASLSVGNIICPNWLENFIFLFERNVQWMKVTFEGTLKTTHQMIITTRTVHRSLVEQQ